MERKLRRQQTRQQPKCAWKNKLCTRIAINETIPNENCGALQLSVVATRRLRRDKRIVATRGGRGGGNVASQQAVTDRFDCLGF